MELGNFVLDGKYSAGDTPDGRALNLEWARIIAQELLGQEEYKIAVDYDISRPGLPADKAMWLRFCKRAAAYNVDLAQNFYAQAIAHGEAPNHTGYDQIAWLKLASEKQTGLRSDLRVLESGITGAQHKDAEEAYDALVQTRSYDGAYYPFDDPLRTLTPSAIASMPQDDPDVQLRRAFSLERAARTNRKAYREAMDLYRTVRDRREIDVRFVLGRNALNGTNGIPKNPSAAQYWLHIAADRGSKPAKKLLDTLAVESPTPQAASQ
jgi:TPR repeat protein